MDHIYKNYSLAQIWFDDVECIMFDGKTLVLNTDSDVRRSLLKRSAAEHLRTALKELYQLDVTVVVLDAKPLIDTSRIKEKLSVAKVVAAICEHFNLSKEQLFDPDAKHPANLAFRTAMFFLSNCKYSVAEIAQLFSRDESTVNYGIYSISCGIKDDDPDILKMVNEIRIKLEQFSAEETV